MVSTGPGNATDMSAGVLIDGDVNFPLPGWKATSRIAVNTASSGNKFCRPLPLIVTWLQLTTRTKLTCLRPTVLSMQGRSNRHT